LARLDEQGSFKTWIVSCADEALQLVKDEPHGVGIDSPMWWSSGPSSDRKADQRLRRRYGIPSGTVQTANSLRGAALVQGFMFATLIRERYKHVPITESHPKALCAAFGFTTWDDVKKRFGLHGERPSDHGYDALLGAIAAREGLSGRWTGDLTRSRGLSEQNPARLSFGAVSYYWPEEP
jgi:hypothetical protein